MRSSLEGSLSREQDILFFSNLFYHPESSSQAISCGCPSIQALSPGFFHQAIDDRAQEAKCEKQNEYIMLLTTLVYKLECSQVLEFERIPKIYYLVS